jgi:hypothetical protein
MIIAMTIIKVIKTTIATKSARKLSNIPKNMFDMQGVSCFTLELKHQYIMNPNVINGPITGITPRNKGQ